MTDPVNEMFYHDEFRRRATRAVEMLPGIWRRDKKISPSVLAWPHLNLPTDDGGKAHLVTCELPSEVKERPEMLKALIRKVHPYALLVVEQHSDCVKAIFETSHGVRCWTLPIIRHGDVVVLEKAQVEDYGECLGLLWRSGPKR